MPAGPYVQAAVEDITATLTVDGTGFAVGGNLYIEQIEVDDSQQTQVALTDFTVTLGDGEGNNISVTDGSGALLVTEAGMAGVISGKAEGNAGSFSAGAGLSVRLNLSLIHI